jgi:hypothetical protein
LKFDIEEIKKDFKPTINSQTYQNIYQLPDKKHPEYNDIQQDNEDVIYYLYTGSIILKILLMIQK